MSVHSSTPWYFLPFLWIWQLAGIILGRLGKRNSIIVGSILVVVGLMNSLSIIGAVVGIPVLLVGAAVLLRALLPPRP